MNVDRMRRYIYRTTPDRVVRHFDLLSDNLRRDQERFLEWFKLRMIIKHGPHIKIDIIIDDMLRTHPSDVAVIAIARPIKGRMRIVNTPPSPRRGAGTFA